MAHTTNIYYRDRLGFEPEYEAHLQSSQQNTTVTKSIYTSGSSRSYQQSSYSTNQGVEERQQQVTTSSSTAIASANSTHGVYEENLTKFKGAYSISRNMS